MNALHPDLSPPWLIADLQRPRRILSFAPYHPGFHTASCILLREVRDADLSADFDAKAWLGTQMDGIGHQGDVGMMTSRALNRFRLEHVGPVTCLATVGLGNAERVGQRRDAVARGYGTINLIISIDRGLSETAMIEALTIAAQARTLAVLTAGIMLPSGLATGTGTDCIALACDPGEQVFAGLHTELGEAVGRAVHDAVLRGAREWIEEHGSSLRDNTGTG